MGIIIQTYADSVDEAKWILEGEVVWDGFSTNSHLDAIWEPAKKARATKAQEEWRQRESIKRIQQMEL